MADEHRKITPAEAAYQRIGSRRIAPGIWEDAEGNLHFSIPELLAVFGWEDTPAEREEVAQILEAVVRDQFPGKPIIRQD